MMASELSYESGISQVLIKQMLEELVRQGYLQSLIRGEATPCNQCPAHKACLFSNRPRIFMLTAKGNRIAANIKGGPD